jgi:ribonuclease Z
MKIFITHMHGDHVLGLPGLLQTMALLDRERKLDIYGPPGIKRFLEGIRETVQFVLTFPLKFKKYMKLVLFAKRKNIMSKRFGQTT